MSGLDSAAHGRRWAGALLASLIVATATCESLGLDERTRTEAVRGEDTSRCGAVERRTVDELRALGPTDLIVIPGFAARLTLWDAAAIKRFANYSGVPAEALGPGVHVRLGWCSEAVHFRSPEIVTAEPLFVHGTRTTYLLATNHSRLSGPASASALGRTHPVWGRAASTRGEETLTFYSPVSRSFLKLPVARLERGEARYEFSPHDRTPLLPQALALTESLDVELHVRESRDPGGDVIALDRAAQALRPWFTRIAGYGKKRDPRASRG